MPERQPIPGVKNLVAVASGKGGVGKTTVAVNLALALSKLGHKVGLLDADVYGPNVPIMLGTNEEPLATQDRRIVPVEVAKRLVSNPMRCSMDTNRFGRG